jgi:hypothetical protein
VALTVAPSCPLAAYSYLQAGVIESATCVLAYAFVFRDNGISWSQMKGFAQPGNGVVTNRDGLALTEDMQYRIWTQAM